MPAVKAKNEGNDYMDPERAKQIAVSPVMANVTYEGNPIYIESVNESQMTADIHFLNMPDNKKQIPLKALVEHGYKDYRG